MKKMVTVCYCDVCGKEIQSERRFTIQLGYGNWTDDEVTTVINKDLCASCYDGFCSLSENEEKTDMVEKVERKRATDEQKKKAFELLDSGLVSQKDIAEMVGVSQATISKWKEARQTSGTVIDTTNYLVQ